MKFAYHVAIHETNYVHAIMLVGNHFISFIVTIIMLIKNTLGICTYKVQGQSEVAFQTGSCDQNFDIS